MLKEWLDEYHMSEETDDFLDMKTQVYKELEIL